MIPIWNGLSLNTIKKDPITTFNFLIVRLFAVLMIKCRKFAGETLQNARQQYIIKEKER